MSDNDNDGNVIHMRTGGMNQADLDQILEPNKPTRHTLVQTEQRSVMEEDRAGTWIKFMHYQNVLKELETVKNERNRLRVDARREVAGQMAMLEARLNAWTVEAGLQKRRADDEERDHLSTMKQRDEHEESINQICNALGMADCDAEWSSANHPPARAIEYIEVLQAEVMKATAPANGGPLTLPSPAGGEETTAKDGPAQPNIGSPGSRIVIENARKDPHYNPYCMRCPGLQRMVKRAPLYWNCHCGAQCDLREHLTPEHK